MDPLLDSNDSLVGVLLVLEHCPTCLAMVLERRESIGVSLQKANSSSVRPAVSGYMK
jgi:hypothetical protein